MRIQGFTLAELLVVILIMAALAATAIPILSSQEHDRLAAASAEVRSALRYARHEAMHRGSSVVVDMETQPNALKLLLGTCQNPGNPLPDPRGSGSYVLNLARGSATHAVQLNAQVLANDNRSYQAFVVDANGALSEACELAAARNKGQPRTGSRVDLKLADQTQTLTLWPLTGRVSGP